MLNRPTIDWDLDEDRDSGWEGPRFAERPQLRIACLYTLLVLPMFFVAARVGHLQFYATDSYLAVFQQTTSIEEEIPAPGGRILSAEGTVLAEDLRVFEVHVHYPWLPLEPDPAWVKSLVRARLKPSQRRKPELVEQEVQRIREEHQAAWNTFLALTGGSKTELLRTRQDVVDKIARMRESVERQRHQTVEGSTTTPEKSDWWRSPVAAIRQALTTPPEREVHAPLVLAEEQDYHRVLMDVSLEVVGKLEEHPELYPALKIVRSTRRNYPAGAIASHVVGYRRPVSPDEFAARRDDWQALGYQLGDWVGVTGLEKHYEHWLRGLRGKRRITYNYRREVVNVEEIQPPRPGQDLGTSLNLPLQQQAEKLLDEALKQVNATASEATASRSIPRGGSIVVLDVRTGEILVAASAPRFDLRVLTDRRDDEWSRLQNDPNRPLFPRVTQMMLPPGSVFKVVTATALLQSGQWNPDAEIECQGYLNVPTRDRCLIFAHYGVGHGAVDMTSALAMSCNVYFYKGIEKLSQPQLVSEWAETLGLGHPTGVDLPYEKGGRVPHPRTRSGRSQQPVWNPGDWRHLAIGQSTLLVTPLQIARLMAQVANDGQSLIPHFGKPVGPRLATTESLAREESLPGEYNTTAPIPGLHPGVLARVREGLRAVVEHPRGTGHKTVLLKEISIAGKTGTAEAGGNRPDHAWFAGYVPADRPRYAMVVVLEHAGSGGKVAGPLARDMVSALLRERLLESRSPAVSQLDRE